LAPEQCDFLRARSEHERGPRDIPEGFLASGSVPQVEVPDLATLGIDQPPADPLLAIGAVQHRGDGGPHRLAARTVPGLLGDRPQPSGQNRPDDRGPADGQLVAGQPFGVVETGLLEPLDQLTVRVSGFLGIPRPIHAYVYENFETMAHEISSIRIDGN